MPRSCGELNLRVPAAFLAGGSSNQSLQGQQVHTGGLIGGMLWWSASMMVNASVTLHVPQSGRNMPHASKIVRFIKQWKMNESQCLCDSACTPKQNKPAFENGGLIKSVIKQCKMNSSQCLRHTAHIQYEHTPQGGRNLPLKALPSSHNKQARC